MIRLCSCLEVEAQAELDEARRVVLRIDGPEGRRISPEVKRHVRTVKPSGTQQQRMVKDIRHLAIEPRAYAFGDLGGLGNAEVDVPAVVAANEAAAVTAICSKVGYAEVRLHCGGIGEGIRFAGMRRRLVNLAAFGDEAGAVAENGALSPLLAAIAVVHVNRKTGAKGPNAGHVPATDDFVQRATAGREVLAPAKRKIVGHQRGEGVAAIKLCRAIVAVEVERVGSLVEARLVLTDLVKSVRKSVVEVKRKSRRGLFAEA